MKQLLFVPLLLLCAHLYGAEKELVLVTKTGNIHGTLLTPEQNPSKGVVALLICGSGPTDRNGNNPQMKNNSIRYLAEDLARAGIASLRYDKRGIAKSGASALTEAELRFTTYVDDAREWVSLLAKSYTQVVVIGHSEGAGIGTLASIDNPKVSSLILLAGIGHAADEVLRTQLADQPQTVKTTAFPIIDSLKKGKTVANIPAMLAPLFRPSVQPYLISWFAIDPAAELKRVKVPKLIIQGDKDIQVSVAEAERLHQSSKEATKVIIPNMNHVFKACTTLNKGAQLPLYNKPELPNVPQLSETIVAFIAKKKK